MAFLSQQPHLRRTGLPAAFLAIVFYDAGVVTERMTPLAGSARRIPVVLLVTAVLALCTGGLVRPMPQEGAAMDCTPRLCTGPAGCSATTIPGLHTVAVAPLPESGSIPGLVAEADGVPAAMPGAAPGRALRALAPRAPPLV